MALKAVVTMLVLAFLAGCVRYNMDVTLLADDRAQVRIDFAIQDAAAEFLGENPASLWQTAQSELEGEVPPGTIFDNYADQGWTGSRITMPPTPITDLAELDELGIPMQITRTDDRFYFAGNAGNIVDELQQEGMEVGELGGAEAIFTLTCPGDVISSNGVAGGYNVVTWDLLGMDGNMTAVCAAVGTGTASLVPDNAAATESWFGRWWPVLLAGLVLLGGLIALATLLRRKAHQDHDTWQNPVQSPENGIGGYWNDDDDRQY